MNSYADAVERLYALGHELHRTAAHKFDLEHMRLLCDALGRPQDSFKAVLIAGTNGKGSTAATISSILIASGIKTALYTSPHLLRVNERIRVDGNPITDEKFASAYERVHEAAAKLVQDGTLPHLPSFFETMTAMAFVHFAEANVDIAVLEVGMGGRLDATNVVEPILSVITDIDLDHQAFLGDTIAKIAFEKAGILRANVPAVTLPQHPEANDLLGRRMIEVGAIGVNAARNMAPVSPGSEALVEQREGRTRLRMNVLGKEIAIDSPLSGRHQLRNLALALTAAEELNTLGVTISPDAVERGVHETHWPGRFQVVSGTSERPTVVLDVAHNPAGAWALRSALTEQFGDRQRVLVFGAMRDKAIREMAQILFPTAERVFATATRQNPRAASESDVAMLARELGTDVEEHAIVAESVDAALRFAGANDALVVITGSIYIVGEAMQYLGLKV